MSGASSGLPEEEVVLIELALERTTGPELVVDRTIRSTFAWGSSLDQPHSLVLENG